MTVADHPVLLRALELYEQERLHFAEAQFVAAAEASGVGRVLSFHAGRVTSARRRQRLWLSC